MRAYFRSTLFIGILASLILLSNSAYAEPVPSRINVSIYVYNIHGFDVSTGLYDVDFYLHFKWNNDTTPQNTSDQVTSFDLMNGRIDSHKTISSDPGDVWLQVSGTFNKRVDLKNYPDDK